VKISIHLDGPTNLRAVGAISVERAALLAGFNGVGKSMAVRLLELCTGRQPWRYQPAAWRSLCNGLNSMQVRVDGLQGASSISWRMERGDWPVVDDRPDAVPPDPADDWFKIEVDGRKASLPSVQELLDVRRISGDSTLTQTIAMEVGHMTDRFRQLAELARGATARDAVVLLERASDAFSTADGIELSRCTLSRDRAIATVRDIQQRLAAASERLATIERGTDLARRVAELATVLPDIDTQLADLASRLNDANEQFEQLRKDLRAADAATARAESSKKDVANARRLADNHRASLQRAREQLAEALTRLDLDSKSTNLRLTVRGRLLEQQDAVQDLKRRRHAIDATPLLDQTLRELLEVLQRAKARGIDAESVVDIDASASITFESLRSKVIARRTRLAAVPPGSTSEVDDAIRRAEAVAASLRAVTNLLDQVERLPPLIERADQRIRTALAGVPDSESLRHLRSSARDAEDFVNSLAQQRAALAGRRLALSDGASPEDIESSLKSTMEALKIESPVDLGPLRVQAAQMVAELRTEYDYAEAEVAQHAENVRRAELDYQAAMRNLGEDELLMRIRTAAGLSVPLGEAAATLRDRVLELQDLPNRLAAVQGALSEIADHIQGRDVRRPTSLLTSVEAWLGEHIANWFGEEAVKSALFPRARNISVDLARRQVEWQENDNDSHELPFEAFSSGQQAFAYTKARLEELGESSSLNRIVALDEFGAFIARDLMDDLYSLLSERRVRHPRDSIILILPVTEDPAQQAKTATGDTRDRYVERARQLESLQYYVEELN
jgi:hypothetical protein